MPASPIGPWPTSTTTSPTVEALYQANPTLPDDIDTRAMARLHAEHHRSSGNGYCTRPATLGCEFEAACERCAHYQTGPSSSPS